MNTRWLLATLLGATLGAGLATARELGGTVRDTTGAVIVNATVEIRGERFSATEKTGPDGDFSVGNLPLGPLRLRVQAAGFAAKEMEIATTASSLAVTLALAPANQTIVVSATRTALPEENVAADVRVIGEPELLASPGELTDDVLQQALGFSLFRRSDSRIANPTSQGVSLRGVGASGASRAIVLRDGVPINDPFGGWVQWDRLPKISLDEIEVARGGFSDLYGANAMSGVVSLVPKRPPTATLQGEISGGSSAQPDVSLFGGGIFHGWESSAAVQTMHSPGYIPVKRAERGLADRPLSLDFTTGEVFLARELGSRARIFLEPTAFYEDRGNGTALQINRTELGQLVLGGDLSSPALGSFGLRLYATGERYHQSFSAISLDRNSESLTRFQIVPAIETGATLQWDRRLGSGQHLVGGLEWRRTRGHTEETAFTSGRPTTALDAGGVMNNLGGFLEDYLRIGPRLLVSAALRGDLWKNSDGSSTTRPLAAPAPQTTLFRSRSETAVSPRLAARYQATERVAFTASVYRAFRPPTLNELYRSFRLGNILTLANSALAAEHMTGGEAGARWRLATLGFRAVFFWAEVDEPIANATLKVTPALITRQRLNLGATRARGAELEGDWRWRELVLRAGYQWTQSLVIENPRLPALVGLRVPQVPANQWTLSSEYATHDWSFAVRARGSGVQFEDDQNLLPLNAYGTVDARIARRIAPGVTAFVTIENAFDQQTMIGRTPVGTFGPPLWARAGLQVRLGGR